jgi:eukaryotic-like serine/threonine-protein kinase
VIARKESSFFPTQLGKYTILERIASGGMATVFVARQHGVAGFERIVALKACHEQLRENDAFAAMFLDEARLAARIRHPNVVATLDVNDGIPMYLVMEYVEGGSLSSLVRAARRRGQRLPTNVSLRIVMDMLAGLQATHDCRGSDGRSLGLVHCDVSPQNVLVGFDGNARITDFGIARALAFAREDDGLIKGKMAYLAPEQLVAGATITQRVDLFSAGVVLWELLTGERLFRESRAGAPVLAPSALDPRLAIFDEIVMRALAHTPSRRFASAVDFLAALEALPMRPATARVVGDYVRRYVGSGIRSHAAPPRSSFAPSAIVKVNRPLEHGREIPTQIVAPTPELLAAVTEPRPHEPAPANAMRTRRVVVAVALLLLGCAGGVLAATQANDVVVQAPP